MRITTAKRSPTRFKKKILKYILSSHKSSDNKNKHLHVITQEIKWQNKIFKIIYQTDLETNYILKTYNLKTTK